MSMSHCIFTVFNKAYASQAICMAESFRLNHGMGVKIIAVIVDVLTEQENNYFSAFDEIIYPKDLNIPNFDAWIFGLDIFEAATAIKSFAFCYLLERYSHVTYVDPDTICYSKLEEVLDLSSSWDLALTPHHLEPKKDAWLVEATELESLKFGVYNLGFLSLRATINGKVIARWWCDRCYEYGVSDAKKGLYVDQKFFDLAPGLFSGVHILRHAGYNVASWNLSERIIKLSNNGLTSNGLPLRFCHYSDAKGAGSLAIERMRIEDSFFIELLYVYIIKLKEVDESLINFNNKWYYEFFEDGTIFPPDIKIKFRKLADRFKFVNPFSNKDDIIYFLNQ
jgi:hypothetical protein